MQLQNPLLLKPAADHEKGLPTHVASCETEEKRVRWQKSCTSSRRLAFLLGTVLFWVACWSLGSFCSWFGQNAHAQDKGAGGNVNGDDTQEHNRWQKENGIAFQVGKDEDYWSSLGNLTSVEIVRKQAAMFGAPPDAPDTDPFVNMAYRQVKVTPVIPYQKIGCSVVSLVKAEFAAVYPACSTEPTVQSGCPQKSIELEPRFPSVKIQYTPGQLIQLGREVMKRSSILFAGVSRNNARTLPRVTAQIDIVGKMFRKSGAIVVENDSNDTTIQLLKEWSSRSPNVKIMSYTLNITAANGQGNLSLRRFQILSLLRNMYMSQLQHREYTSYDYVAVVDMDLEGGLSRDGVAHSFGLMAAGLEWDMMCSNGMAYNRGQQVCLVGGALNHPENGIHAPTLSSDPNNSLARDFTMLTARFYDSLAFRDRFWGKRNYFGHHALAHDHHHPPQYVDSCFGGLAIYKREAMQECSYDGTDDCEHVALHRCMVENGKRLMFNPRQVVLY